MKKQVWRPYVFWILLTEAVGALAAALTREGTELYQTAIQKPPLSPPAIVFPIAWVLLYALMGVGMARVALSDREQARKNGLHIYLTQLAFNFFWSIIFFNFRNYGFAFLWLIALWALILWMILLFRKADRIASYLQIPYLLWVTFAGYLNAGVWLLNR